MHIKRVVFTIFQTFMNALKGAKNVLFIKEKDPIHNWVIKRKSYARLFQQVIFKVVSLENPLTTL